MLLEQQVRPLASIERFRHLVRNCLLSVTMGAAVIVAIYPGEDPDQHMRTIGGNGGNGCYPGKEQNAVGARIGDAVEPLQHLTRVRERTDERTPQVAAKFVLNPRGDLFQALRREIQQHYGGFQSSRERLRRSCQNLPRRSPPISRFSEVQPFAHRSSLAG